MLFIHSCETEIKKKVYNRLIYLCKTCSPATNLHEEEE